MRTYSERHIRKAEIAQLILLYHLYSRPESKDLVFQGGTALRWCYGGSRFSEDLDFVTNLPTEALRQLLARCAGPVERSMIAHFGPGRIELLEKASRASSVKSFVTFRPERDREKISVKVEFEGLQQQATPDTARLVLSSLPSVGYMIGTGDFRIPRPSAVLIAETTEEILSDKVRALLERPYLKGRDIFDVWHLRTMLRVATGKELIERKLRMYSAPFTATRGLAFFIAPSPAMQAELATAIEMDLSRFLPPEVLAVHRGNGYRDFLMAVRDLMLELQDMELSLP